MSFTPTRPNDDIPVFGSVSPLKPVFKLPPGYTPPQPQKTAAQKPPASDLRKVALAGASTAREVDGSGFRDPQKSSQPPHHQLQRHNGGHQQGQSKHDKAAQLLGQPSRPSYRPPQQGHQQRPHHQQQYHQKPQNHQILGRFWY
ncbi:hypothetical protein SAICODRAFT_99135 [Saitoella complicata NRRL Y-17804]|uniref:uncharacterized protein n=1 Tax=Saitoella complicata (strain BCRC 22490 / CBS 7301 / JCM 7358 / NBRC 10748 / NRRL Y-17804) TaxID=698492 RepID=UPI000866A2F7|nr:uncharacterized protein SAICODRAFT_99135 [Saitoella complicata NRRL Y-17804]ODQ55967.1 hypothetical protein SAICODRAFT_99135 [Saitoella complicata NRRL Y-17804]